MIRLPPDLDWQSTPQEFFAPSEWNVTTALGGSIRCRSTCPTVGPGRRCCSHARERPGVSARPCRPRRGPSPLAEQKVGNDGYVFSPAAYRMGQDMLVAMRVGDAICPGKKNADRLVALRISGGPQPALHTAWCADLNGQGAPIVTTSDDAADPIIWIAGPRATKSCAVFAATPGRRFSRAKRYRGYGIS